jgi:hypothetical protein
MCMEQPEIFLFFLSNTHCHRNGLWKWRGFPYVQPATRQPARRPARVRPRVWCVWTCVGALRVARNKPRFRLPSPDCDVHRPTRKRASERAEEPTASGGGVRIAIITNSWGTEHCKQRLRGWSVHVTDNHAGSSPSPLTCTPSAALPMTGRGRLCSLLAAAHGWVTSCGGIVCDVCTASHMIAPATTRGRGLRLGKIGAG